MVLEQGLSLDGKGVMDPRSKIRELIIMVMLKTWWALASLTIGFDYSYSDCPGLACSLLLTI